MVEGTRLRTYDLLYYYTKRIRKFSIANMMTSVWRRFKQRSTLCIGVDLWKRGKT